MQALSQPAMGRFIANQNLAVVSRRKKSSATGTKSVYSRASARTPGTTTKLL